MKTATVKARASASARATWVSLALLVLGVFVLRLLWLDADAASTLTWSGAPFTDEGLYSHAARNRVLFGTWRTDGWDNRLVSPLFDVLAFLVFRVAGVGYAQLRLINVVLTTLALPLWWAFLRRDVGERWAFLGVGLLGLNYFWFQYSRLGLLEPGVVVWLIASAWCWRRAVDGSWRWAIGCGVCAGIAWIWKSLALVFLPVPLLALLLLQPRGGRRIAIGYVWGTVVALTIYAVAWYLPHAAELTRYNQFYAADRVPSSFTEAWRSLSNNLRSRYIIGQAPLLLGVALAGVVCAAAAIRRKNVAPMPVFCLVWLVCGAVVLIMPYSPPRYYTLLVPALVGLAVSAIRAADNHKFQPLLFLVLAALGAQTVWDGGRYVTWAHGRTTTLPDSSRALAQVVPEHTMLLGVTACGLSLENKLPCAPLIAGLANDGNPFTMLNTRYVVVENNNRDDWMRRFAPQALAEATPLQTLPLGPRRVTVYRLKDNSIEEVRMSRSIVVDSSSGKNRPR